MSKYVGAIVIYKIIDPHILFTYDIRWKNFESVFGT